MKKILITVSALTALIFVLKSFGTMDELGNSVSAELKDVIAKFYKPLKVVITGNLDKDIAAFVQAAEGGLTDDPDDSASEHPTNVMYTYKGKTSSKWHTNKGITWQAYKAHFPNKSAADFYAMSQPDWTAIFVNDYMKPFVTYSNNKLVNYILGLWAWGSGVGGAKASLNNFIKKYGDLNALIAKDKDDAIAKLILWRTEFFKKAAEAKPKNAKYLGGWINRTLNFYKNFTQYI